MKLVDFAPGAYRFIHVEGVFQFSSGVAAEPGFAIERARLPRPLPLLEGFAAVERHLAAIGRPTTAFCACELRSPAPLTEQGFVDFNRQYVGTLERWGLYADDVNPVSRTNVIPVYDAPPEPSLHAFCYTVELDAPIPSFVIAGSSEADQGPGEYRDSIVRLGETSVDAMRDKLRCVRAEQEKRLGVLGLGWRDVATTHAYSAPDIGPLIQEELLRYGAGTGAVTWIEARPPVVDLEFEMDARTIVRDIVLTSRDHETEDVR
jgi:hypothetical protein